MHRSISARTTITIFKITNIVLMHVVASIKANGITGIIKIKRKKKIEKTQRMREKESEKRVPNYYSPS